MALFPVRDDEKKKPTLANREPETLPLRNPRELSSRFQFIPGAEEAGQRQQSGAGIGLGSFYQDVPEFTTAELPERPERNEFMSENDRKLLKWLRIGGAVATGAGALFDAPLLAAAGSGVVQGAGERSMRANQSYLDAVNTYYDTLPDVLKANMDARNRRIEMQATQNRQLAQQQGQARINQQESSLDRQEYRFEVQNPTPSEQALAESRRASTDMTRAELEAGLPEARAADIRSRAANRGRTGQDEEAAGMDPQEAREAYNRTVDEIGQLEKTLQQGEYTDTSVSRGLGLDVQKKLTPDDRLRLEDRLDELYERRRDYQRAMRQGQPQQQSGTVGPGDGGGDADNNARFQSMSDTQQRISTALAGTLAAFRRGQEGVTPEMVQRWAEYALQEGAIGDAKHKQIINFIRNGASQ